MSDLTDMLDGNYSPPQAGSRPSAPSQSRADRNNNWGNLKASKANEFPGQTGIDPNGFAIFDNPQSGQSAAEQNLIARQSKHGLNTIQDIIADPKNGWDPGNTKYAQQVAAAVGLKPTDPVDVVNNPTLRQQILHAGIYPVERGTGGADQTLTGMLGGGAMDDAAAQSAYQAAHGQDPSTGAIQASGTDVKWLPGSAIPPGAPGPTPAQATAANFLNQYGFWNPDAEPGSSTHPLGMTGNVAAPTKPGQWYLTTDGKLMQAGSGNDYLPGYRALAAVRNQDAAHPFQSFFEHGLPQGLEDVGASINNLMGGAMALPDRHTNLQATYGPDWQNIVRDMPQGSIQQTIADRNAFNLQHGASYPAMAGRVAGNALGVAPLMAGGEGALGVAGDAALNAAPKLAPIVQGASDVIQSNPLLRLGSQAAQGAGQGATAALLTNSTSDAPIQQQVIQGAETGAIANPVFHAGGAIANDLMGGSINPAVSDLASTAVNKYNIPLRRGQILYANGDRHAGIADSNGISQWGTGFSQNQAAQREAFTRAVSRTFGEDSPALTPDVMQSAKTRIGNVFNDVADRTDIVDGDGVVDKIKGIIADASDQGATSDELRALNSHLDRIQSAIDGTGQIPGEAYQALTKSNAALDRATSHQNANISYPAQQIKRALDDGMIASAAPEDSAALQNARWQYKNLMTIKNLAAKAGIDGTISPTLLNGAVNTSFKNRAFTGAGDLGELSQIGQAFIKEPGNSQTTPRLIDALKGWGMAGLGADLSSNLFLHDPTAALKIGLGTAAIGGLKAAGNVVGGAYARSPIIRNMLLSGGNVPVPAANILRIAQPAYVPATVLGANRLMQMTPDAQPVAQPNAQYAQ